MNILVLSWRDIKNPRSGGAEVLTHEIARSWVKAGHTVTVFSSHFKNSLPLEIIDGVKIIRKGHPDTRFLFTSVHFQAFIYYFNNSKNFDVVIDEIHGMPFFTPWYVRGKKVVLICEVAGSLWIKMFGQFFGRIGRLMEQFYLKFIYKNIPYLTISESTKRELINEGVSSKNITVLPMGITFPKKIKKYEKEKTPTLIYVGRLSKSKGIEDAIKSLVEISKIFKGVKLWIVGSGETDYADFLRNMAKKLKVNNKVTFFGYVNQEKKFELMGRAHILVAPSLKEGWGLTIPEAALVGTPSVVYNSPGLRDVLNNEGYKTITKKNTQQALADEVIKQLKNRDLNKISKLRIEDYSWDKTARKALRIIEE